MNTEILTKNPQTTLKAIQKGTFVCLGSNERPPIFNEDMIAVGTVTDANIKKLGKIAKELCLTKTHHIYHVADCGRIIYHYEA
jgi:hypothetical protein